MGRQITKELAEKIASKLKAVEASKSGAHTLMNISHNGKLVTQIGIRHGSSKDQGHDHIQKQLNVRTRFAKELGICTKSREQWVHEMQEKGLIQPD